VILYNKRKKLPIGVLKTWAGPYSQMQSKENMKSHILISYRPSYPTKFSKLPAKLTNLTVLHLPYYNRSFNLLIIIFPFTGEVKKFIYQKIPYFEEKYQKKMDSKCYEKFSFVD